MPKQEQKAFMLSDLPHYDYSSGAACPECFRPLANTWRRRKDGRCDKCLADKMVLPVNYRRTRKRKSDDEDEDRRYDNDE